MSWCPKRWALTIFIPITFFAAALPASSQKPSDYSRITDLVHEITGNGIRLSVEPARRLPPPQVQYLNSASGEYVMACDFPGAVWSRPTQVVFPGLEGLEQIRIGQFQANPPICRIAVSAQKLALLHKLVFRSEPGVLVLKWPEQKRAAAYQNAGKPSLKAAGTTSAWDLRRLPSTPGYRPAAAASSYAVAAAGTGLALTQSSRARPLPPITQRLEHFNTAPLHPNNALAPAAPVTPAAPVAPASPIASAPLPGSNSDSALYQPSYSSSLPPDGIQMSNPARPPLAPDRFRLPASGSNRLAAAPVLSNPALPLNRPPHLLQTRQSPANSDTPEANSADNFPAASGPAVQAPGGLQAPPAGILRASGLAPAPPATAPRQISSPAPALTPARQIQPVPAPRTLPVVAASDKGKPPAASQPLSVPTTSDKTPATASSSNTPAVLPGSSPDQLIVRDVQALEYRTFRLHEPERYVLDFKHFPALQAAANSGTLNNSLLRSWRTGHPQDDPSIARLVLDLDSADTVVKEELNPDQQILTLTLQKAGLQAEKLHIPPGTTVVIDAGHGGSDPGAQRGDIQEKEITLGIVEKLRKKLAQAGAKVTMTRTDDTFVSLEDRVSITNTISPQLFLSVHINSLETNSNISGIETYYQSEQSKALADAVHKALVNKLQAADRNVRKARFYVINHTPVPSVLAEVGFISNKEERSKLVSADYQEQVADALLEGVACYVSGHEPPMQSAKIKSSDRPQLAQKTPSAPAAKKESK